MLPMIALILAGLQFVHEPTSSYRRVDLEGFPVLISKAAQANVAELDPALAVLRRELKEVKELVPKPALVELQKVRIFMENNNPGFPCACYHPDAGWLKANGYNVDKVHSVEISNLKNFVDWIEKWQPLMVLHELAHAYHRAKFGYEDPYIEACYQRVKVSKLYEMVDRNSGKRDRHYALTNQMEYFAETTEAYFGENDFWPFRRSQLAEADPQGLAMIERLWGIDRKTK
ncbi:MAG TPA: hypothetical protein PKA27_10905 [Fimbriimonadaceae bacterium]|nr:hypothetical protein [Fimbriimonadaceae bacterium]